MKKIILILAIFLLIGTVCAAHNNEIFTAPKGLHKMGYNDFVDEKGHNIMIIEDSDSQRQKWFENDTNYIVSPYESHANMYLGAGDENDCYILEVVEKDGAKYIISSWTPKGPTEAKKISDNLLEFNKVNNLKPIEV